MAHFIVIALHHRRHRSCPTSSRSWRCALLYELGIIFSPLLVAAPPRSRLQRTGRGASSDDEQRIGTARKAVFSGPAIVAACLATRRG